MSFFQFKFDYNKELIRLIKTLPVYSRRWNPELTAWEIAAEEIFHLAKLIEPLLPERADQLLDDPAYQPYREIADNKKQEIQNSRATTAEIEIPKPEGEKYLPFQKAGIKYALDREATLIGDEMGLGKSIEALGIVNYTNHYPVIIICPASLKINWAKEASKWLVKESTIIIMNGNPIGKIINTLKGFFLFDFKMGKKGNKKRTDSHSTCNCETITDLSKFISVFGTHSLSRVIFDRQNTRQPFHNGQKGIINANYPITAIFNSTFCDMTFTIEKTRNIGQILNRIRHINNTPPTQSTNPTISSSPQMFMKSHWINIQIPRNICNKITPEDSGNNTLDDNWIKLGPIISGNKISFSLHSNSQASSSNPKFGGNRVQPLTIFDTGGSLLNLPVRQLSPRHDNLVVVINYDILKSWMPLLQLLKDPSIIIDEIHFCKNSRAKRSKLVKELVEKCNPAKTIGLTGTAIPNRPIELWMPLHILKKELFPSFWVFAHRYCNAYQDGYGWRLDGASNLDELHERLRSTIMIRRLKRDVLLELPPKTRQIIELPCPDSIYALEQTKMAELKQILLELEELKDRLKADDSPEAEKSAYEEAVKRLNQHHLISFEEMSRIRHQTAVAKIPDAIKVIDETLESKDKLIIFAHHRDVIDRLVEHYGEKQAVKLYGGMSQEAKQLSIDLFQTDSKIKLFIGSIQAAGVGITLTAADTVIFVELDWVPGNITQAEDRTHRIGQYNAINIYHIVYQDTIDCKLAHTIVQKQRVIDEALDTGMRKVAMADVDAFKAGEKKQQEYAKAEESITPKDKIEILLMLQYLSSRCDGAYSEDGMGFNKVDTAFGKDLASQHSLSAGQALAAKKMLKKYKAQLEDGGFKLAETGK